MSKESMTQPRIWWVTIAGAFKFQNNNCLNKLNCSKNNTENSICHSPCLEYKISTQLFVPMF